MELIKELELFNFQSHKHTKLNFTNGLNVITGPSDQGKSAIIRALRWVLYNEPSGTDFIKIGSDECQVKLSLNNGFQIVRKRNSKENCYIIIGPQGKEKVLEKVGRDVPQEVVELHGMPKISWDTDSRTTLNLDYQLDGAFLLTDSSYTRAKVLGRLSRVHVVDSAVRSTVNDISTLKQSRHSIEENIDRIEQKLEGFADLEELATEIEAEKKLLNQIKSLKSKVTELKQLNNELLAVDKKIQQTDQIIEQLKDLDRLQALYQQAVILRDKEEDYRLLAKNYIKNQQKIKQTEKIIKKTVTIKQLKQKVNNLIEKSTYYKRLKKLSSSKKENQNSLKAKQRLLDLTENTAKIKDITKKLERKEANINYLIKTRKEYKELEETFVAEKSFYQKFSGVNKAEELKLKLDEKIKRVAKLKELANLQEDTEERIKKGRDYINDNQFKLDQLLDRYNQLLKEIGKCPICFNQIDKETVNDIIDNYRRDK